MFQFNRSKGTLILLCLLLAAMLLTAALTFEAVTAERAHQASVRRAIRDDASVVADDLLRVEKTQTSILKAGLPEILAQRLPYGT